MWYEESKQEQEVHEHHNWTDKLQAETQRRQSPAVPVAFEIPEGRTKKRNELPDSGSNEHELSDKDESMFDTVRGYCDVMDTPNTREMCRWVGGCATRGRDRSFLLKLSDTVDTIIRSSTGAFIHQRNHYRLYDLWESVTHFRDSNCPGSETLNTFQVINSPSVILTESFFLSYRSSSWHPNLKLRRVCYWTGCVPFRKLGNNRLLSEHAYVIPIMIVFPQHGVQTPAEPGYLYIR